MLLKGTENRKKELVERLSVLLNEKAVYLKAPSFGYQIGPYFITKDGDLEIEETNADLELIRLLDSEEYFSEITYDFFKDEQRLIISTSIRNHTVDSLMNLLHMFCAREKLLNRSVGCAHNFLMNKKFVKSLDENKPESILDFFIRLNEAGGPTINRGLWIQEEKVEVAFPLSEDPDTIKAYEQLVTLMMNMAKKKKRISKSKMKTSNEKYSFRVWLLSLGMTGEDYKIARKVLLKNLPGNGAFRTTAQEEIAKEKMRAKKQEQMKTENYIAL